MKKVNKKRDCSTCSFHKYCDYRYSECYNGSEFRKWRGY